MSGLDVAAVAAACSRERHEGAEDEALQAWRGLVSGRWSLVERFESDGRRYLVARRNPPGTPPGAAITPLEAQALVMRAQGASYKLVAYELDQPISTVHQLVKTGASKLGVQNESELPMLLGRGRPPPDAAP